MMTLGGFKMADLNQEFSKDSIDKALEAIELAKKSGKIKKGINEVTKVIERGHAKFVAIAKDVNPQEVIMHLPPLCEEKEVKFVVVNSKEDLGAAAGLQVGTSAVTIVQEGDAKDTIKSIK
jgi:large subunit ribosomal protein L7Ae